MNQIQHTLHDAWPSKPIGPAFLTTYTFDPFFFESHILHELQRREAFPIVVFADSSSGYRVAMESGAELTHVNRDYFLVEVDWPKGVFHPKVHLFPDAGVAVVGSGNLTNPGFGGNLEAFDRITSSADGVAVNGARSFMRDLINHSAAGISTPLRSKFLNLLTTNRDHESTGDALFFHTLQGGMLDDLLIQDSVPDLETVLIASPFFDTSHKATSDLHNGLNPQRMLIASSSGSPPSGPPIGTPGFVHLEDEDGRILHAKLIHGKGSNRGFSVVGSANMTTNAWRGRNVEAVIFRPLDNTTIEQDCPMFDPLALFQESAWVEGARSQIDVQMTDGARPWKILAAVLDQNIIRVEFSGHLEPPNFQMTFGDNQLDLDFLIEDDGTWVTGFDDSLPGPAVLRVTDQIGHTASVVVTQLQFLNMPLFERRRYLLRSKLGQKIANISDQIEMLAWLRDLIVAEPKRSAKKTLPPESTTGNSDNSIMSYDTSDATAIQDIHEMRGAQTGQDSGVASLWDLVRRIADTASGFTSRPHESTRRGFVPKPEDESTLGAEREKRRSSKQKFDDNRKLDIVVIKLANDVLARDYTQDDVSRNQFIQAYDSGLRLLAGRIYDQVAVDEDDEADQEPDLIIRKELARLLRELLQKAWAKPFWGIKSSPGLFLQVEEIAIYPSVGDAKAALVLCHWVLDGSETKDWVASIHMGLMEIESGVFPRRDSDPDHPALLAAPNDVYSDTVQALGRYRPQSEKAYEKLENLRNLAKIHQNLEELKSNPTDPASIEEKTALRLNLLTELRKMNRDLEQAWRRVERTKFEPKVYQVDGGACPQCWNQLPSGVNSHLHQPDNFAVCENCLAILLPGPLFRVDS